MMCGEMKAEIYEDIEGVAKAAADNTYKILKECVAAKGFARVIFATGNSQLPFLRALREFDDMPWSKITAFHMDEYIGLDAHHPASFFRWIKENIEEMFSPQNIYYISSDPESILSTCFTYEELLKEDEVDLVCMGIGENGHIAFNEPHIADIDDPVLLKVIKLDNISRQQQVNEGHFIRIDEVPSHAITLTVPALIMPKHIQVVVPEKRKADAVSKTFNESIGSSCPSTFLRTCPNARIFIDRDGAIEILH